MEKREQYVEVVKAELRKSQNPSSDRSEWVRVELNTGHAFTCRPDQAPRVGDRLLLTLAGDVVSDLPSLILQAATSGLVVIEGTEP